MSKNTYMAVFLAATVVLAAQGGGKRGKASKNEATGGGTSNVSSSVSSSSGVSVKTVNGQTTVSYKGQEVFKGPTTGTVSARSSSVNGTEYAAAFDGDKVIWESTSGAAEQVKALGANPPNRDPAAPKKSGKKRRGEL